MTDTVYVLPKVLFFYPYQRTRCRNVGINPTQLYSALANVIQIDSLAHNSRNCRTVDWKRELKDSLHKPEFSRILEMEVFEDFHPNPVCTRAAPSTALISEV